MTQAHLERVRRICEAFPETEERLSHGEPTFFIRKKVYAMCANNHHGDGRIAVWLPAPPGMQAMLVERSPEKYFKPPYVGVRGWIGVNLECVSDDELEWHVLEAWRLVAPKRLQDAR
jgi:hypothetical protein